MPEARARAILKKNHKLMLGVARSGTDDWYSLPDRTQATPVPVPTRAQEVGPMLLIFSKASINFMRWPRAWA